MEGRQIVEALCQNGPRPAFDAGASGVAAQELIASELRELGLDVEFEPFPLLTHAPDTPSLEIDGAIWVAGPCMYSHPTPAAGVHGTLEYVGLDPFLPGLFEPLRFSIRDAAGDEVGRIYGNPIDGGGAGAFAASPGPTLTPPAAYVGNADAIRLRDCPRRPRVHLVTGGTLAHVLQRNVLGYGTRRAERTMVVSAHYDSAVGSPGAIDNASGVAGVLELARELVRVSTPSVNFLFVFFAAEEAGLSGARAFVDRRRAAGGLDRIAAVVNLDCLGVGERLSVMTTDDLRPLVEAVAVDSPVALLPPGPGADHFPFASEGVPALTAVSFPYADYHLPTDRPDLFDSRQFAADVKLARAIIDSLIRTLP